MLTRDAAIGVLPSVAYAPITRTIRGICSEVAIGPVQGLPDPCVISCDNVITVPIEVLDDRPVGHLDEAVHGRGMRGRSVLAAVPAADDEVSAYGIVVVTLVRESHASRERHTIGLHFRSMCAQPDAVDVARERHAAPLDVRPGSMQQ